MSEVEQEYSCHECGDSFILIWNGYSNPEHCAFCGAFIETPEDDEDNWD